jgi:hypothetical protein
MCADNKRKGSRVATTLVAILALLCGCTSGKSQSSSNPVLIGLVSDSPSARDQIGAMITKRNEQILSKCMKNEGFEYTPKVRKSSDFIADWASPEVLRKSGYGTGRLLDLLAESSNGEDPNSRYQASLSETDRTAYQRALFGDSVPPAQPTGGCALKIDASARNLMGSLDSEIKEISERSRSDKEIVAINRRWSKCMTRSGFAAVSRVTTVSELQAEAYSILQAYNADRSRDRESVLSLKTIEFKKRDLQAATADAACQNAADEKRRLQILDGYSRNVSSRSQQTLNSLFE